MADEIKATAGLTITKNGLTTGESSTSTISISGSFHLGAAQSIGTSYEAVNTGSATNIRYVFLKNITTTTSSIHCAVNATSNSFATLRPGDGMVLPLSGSSLLVKATNLATPLQVIATEA